MPPKYDLLPKDKKQKKEKERCPWLHFLAALQILWPVEEDNQKQAKEELETVAKRNLELARQQESKSLTFAKIYINDSECLKFTGFAIQHFSMLMELLKEQLLLPST